jgi:transposase
LARADARVMLLDTIPGVGDLLGLTLASEIGDVARFGSPRKLIGYAGLAPKIRQSGDPLAHRRALQGRLADPALGRRRGRPTRLAPNQPPGTRSIPTSPSARARTRPRPPSRARS